MCGETVRLTQ